jgi:acetyl-CoA carboxylase biotin carboxyl carrier protein
VTDLTPEDVQEILRLVDESGFDELELETPRFSIRFRRSQRTAPSNTLQLGEVREPPGSSDGLVDVTAPMVGTFYRAPAPGEAPFVEVGSPVDERTQVCIIEVMKLMSSVPAGTRGTIAEICCENGAAVEYGDVLFRVRS